MLDKNLNDIEEAIRLTKEAERLVFGVVSRGAMLSENPQGSLQAAIVQLETLHQRLSRKP